MIWYFFSKITFPFTLKFNFIWFYRVCRGTRYPNKIKPKNISGLFFVLTSEPDQNLIACPTGARPLRPLPVPRQHQLHPSPPTFLALGFYYLPQTFWVKKACFSHNIQATDQDLRKLSPNKSYLDRASCSTLSLSLGGPLSCFSFSGQTQNWYCSI